jgi:uncharacterized protein (DUF2225 family)
MFYGYGGSIFLLSTFETSLIKEHKLKEAINFTANAWMYFHLVSEQQRQFVWQNLDIGLLGFVSFLYNYDHLACVY